MIKEFVRSSSCAALLWIGAAVVPHAQPASPVPAAAPASDAAMQPHMSMPEAGAGWTFMQDGVVFAMLNRQGGPRGDTEFRVPNWWMGMATRKVKSSSLTLNAMLSLDPATVGKRGYAEIFQVGEALNGAPVIDRQHPHDLFMQLAAVWRVPVGADTGLTLAGAPAGEPALGPVAFMHRASAAENPLAALSHHTFDSTHIAYGVITAAVDRGPWVVEGSLFNGREPDENRWDFDFGRLDSVSARVWYRPVEAWEFQVSTGHLTHPETLEPGNIQRTTMSGSWFRRHGGDYTAVTAAYGANATEAGTRHAAFVEATRRAGRLSVFGRGEIVQVETGLLLGDHHAAPAGPSLRTPVPAVTIGGVRDLAPRLWWRGFAGGVGAQMTIYGVPEALTASHGAHPVSFQVFFRLRPPAGTMGRMWNMRMSQPMTGQGMQSMPGMGGMR